MPSGLPQSLQGRYQLKNVLGKGGFANVYLAHDSVLDQDVAIKILKLGLASKADTDRFLFEARVGAKLRHHNIAQVFDIIQTPDGLQMIMEYYPHGTLAERIKKKGPMRPREAIDVTRQVAAALGYAHRRTFVHRDVKPANIFFGGEGVVKLGDFGIAARADLHEHTQTGMIIGTPLYMAPEQSHDSRDVDPRADIYALGLTLYFMLTAKAPRVVDLDLVPAPFRRLLKASTEQDRNQRLVSCDQFIAMLDQVEAQLAGSAAGSAAEPNLGETVIEPSRATTLPATGGASTQPLSAAATQSAGEPNTGDPTTGGQTSNPTPTLTSATQASELTTTQTQVNAGVGKGLYMIIAAGFVLIALPLFYLAYRFAGGSPSAPPARELVAVATPTPSPTVEITPEPTPTPSPTASPAPTASPTPRPALTSAPSPTPVALVQTPPPTPRPTVTPAPPLGPIPLNDAIRQRTQERERIARVVSSLEGAGRESTPALRNVLLRAAMSTLESELTEQPADVVTRVLAASTLRQLALPRWQRELGDALRLNAQRETPIELDPGTLSQFLGLTPAETQALERMMGPRPRLGPGQGPAMRRPGGGPRPRVGQQPAPPAQ
jgi:serine/threonine protein kinase